MALTGNSCLCFGYVHAVSVPERTELSSSHRVDSAGGSTVPVTIRFLGTNGVVCTDEISPQFRPAEEGKTQPSWETSASSSFIRRIGGGIVFNRRPLSGSIQRGATNGAHEASMPKAKQACSEGKPRDVRTNQRQ